MDEELAKCPMESADLSWVLRFKFSCSTGLLLVRILLWLPCRDFCFLTSVLCYSLCGNLRILVVLFDPVCPLAVFNSVAIAVPGALTRKNVEDVCAEVWERVKERLPSMPPEQYFKHSYSRSSKELCTLKGRAVLLLEGLEDGDYIGSASEVLGKLRDTDLCFLIDASGSGKTRTLYEISCQRDSIYLTGVTESGSGDEGSRDLYHVATELGRLYPEGVIPEDALMVCLTAVFISRFYILREARSAGIDVTRLVWLFKQLYFSHLNYPWRDPWRELTRRILSLIRNSSDIEAASDIFPDILDELKRQVRWDDKGVVVIDECQELSHLLENRFRGLTVSDVNLSMLDKLALALRDMKFENTIISGTGRHLIRMLDSLSETVKDKLSYYVYSDFGHFSSAESIKEYTVKFVKDVCDFDFSTIFGVYRGRYRFYVTVLQMFLRDSEEQRLVATDYFLKKADDLCRRPGPALSINRSVWDDVVKFFALPSFHPGCWEVVITLLLLRVYTGVPVSLAVTDSDLRFVQAGIGRLRRTGESSYQPLHFKPDTDFCSAAPQNAAQVSLRTVEIGEPLVVRALWNYLTASVDVQKKLINDMGVCSKSELGVKFEPYSAPLLLQFLENKAPVDFIPKVYKEKVDPVYKHPLQVPRSNNCEMIQQMPEEDNGMTFLAWLEQFEVVLQGKQQESFRPFFYSGNVIRFGPDMIAACISKVGEKQVPVFSLYQHKVRSKTDLTSALDRLDIDDLFLHNKGFKERSQIEEIAVTKFKQFLHQGGLLKWIICFTTDINVFQNDDLMCGSVPKIHKRKRIYEKLKITGLVGIIDKHMQVMVEENAWFVNAVEYLKYGE
ncbi:hypothetical protein SELMODRAFT_402002 [Selaginella moellendorffii]|uniref:Uncharacterized protein xyz n=1 Tax=Selaginella moellendorffii TaxID=88036 RepID=D8QP98_SELML|nr:hypothetical protein SELMODRAFT_402002 [Selaginella moellendorffii]